MIEEYVWQKDPRRAAQSAYTRCRLLKACFCVARNQALELQVAMRSQQNGVVYMEKGSTACGCCYINSSWCLWLRTRGAAGGEN